MVKIERIVDKYLFGAFIPFFYPLKLFDRKTKPRKILLIRLWAIGDSVISLSLIRALKNIYNAKIDVLTRSRVISVYSCYPKINRIINMDDKKEFIKFLMGFRQYDLVFDTEQYLNISAILSSLLGRYRIGFADQWRSCLYSQTISYKTNQHMLQNYLDMVRSLGEKYDCEQLERLTVSKKAKDNVDMFLKKNKKPLLGITPGVAETVKTRMWYAERFAEVADRAIRELGMQAIFIDGPSNKDVVDEVISKMNEKPIDACGRFSLEETFYMISKCKVYLSNDTGPMHIAAAQGCKTIGLFGPNTPVIWGPYGKENIAIYKTNKPVLIENDKGTFKEGNRNDYMGPISVEDVFAAIKKLR